MTKSFSPALAVPSNTGGSAEPGRGRVIVGRPSRRSSSLWSNRWVSRMLARQTAHRSRRDNWRPMLRLESRCHAGVAVEVGVFECRSSSVDACKAPTCCRQTFVVYGHACVGAGTTLADEYGSAGQRLRSCSCGGGCMCLAALMLTLALQKASRAGRASAYYHTGKTV